MSIEATAKSPDAVIHPVAARRILRLALGTALSLCFAQAIGWQLSFIAPIFTLLILSLPMPVIRFKQGMLFIFALLAPMTVGLALIPFLMHMRWVGILLLTLGLFYSFYYTARGGSAVMGSFMTVGLTLIVTIGSVNSDLLTVLIQALAINAIAGISFVWLAHAFLPDLPPDPAVAGMQKPKPQKPDLREARLHALRALLVVLPIALLFLFMSGSPAYTAVMIKVASMGQQASTDNSAAMGNSLLASTFWGGVGALLIWTLLSAWPSLVFFSLLVGLAGLIYGRGIFQGPAVHPRFSMWSYALVTLLVIIGPAVLDTPGSGGAGAAIWSRLWLFIIIALYGTSAVAVFNAFWPGKNS
jgi:hypothetical protein